MLSGTPLADLVSNTRDFPSVWKFTKAYIRYHSKDWRVSGPQYFNRFAAVRYCPDMESCIGKRVLKIEEQHRFVLTEQYRNLFHAHSYVMNRTERARTAYGSSGPYRADGDWLRQAISTAVGIAPHNVLPPS